MSPEPMPDPLVVPGAPPALPVEQVRALIRLLYPDHMTPVAQRMLNAACDEAETPPDEDRQMVAT